MDHTDIRLGLFEAFTIIEGRTDSTVQPSVAYKPGMAAAPPSAAGGHRQDGLGPS